MMALSRKMLEQEPGEIEMHDHRLSRDGIRSRCHRGLGHFRVVDQGTLDLDRRKPMAGHGSSIGLAFSRFREPVMVSRLIR